MITIQNTGTPVFVGTAQGEFALTNAGTWTFPEASYISFASGTQANLGTLREGTTILVDASGKLAFTPGPDLLGAITLGFGLAVSTVGIVLGIIYVIRRITSAGNLSGQTFD